jgi:hypothetical protein
MNQKNYYARCESIKVQLANMKIDKGTRLQGLTAVKYTMVEKIQVKCKKEYL